MVSVPTQEEFDALKLRVEALEAEILQVRNFIQVATTTINDLYALLHPT